MKVLYIFGVKFVDAQPGEILKILYSGGVLVAPSGPGLATIRNKHLYLESLQRSTIAIFDSGLLCLALRLKNIKVKKLSGLKFLIFFLNHLSKNKTESILMVDPSNEASQRNAKLLVDEYNFPIENIHHYVAPIYKEGEVMDPELVHKLNSIKPKYILVNIGGGTQEILADYLYNQKSKGYSPIIICTGAAIAFLTGAQAKIPEIIDTLYMGWLARCLQDFRQFAPRYLGSINLIGLVLREKIHIVSYNGQPKTH